MNSSQVSNSENTDADGQQVYNFSKMNASTENVTAHVETKKKKEGGGRVMYVFHTILGKFNIKNRKHP